MNSHYQQTQKLPQIINQSGNPDEKDLLAAQLNLNKARASTSSVQQRQQATASFDKMPSKLIIQQMKLPFS